MSDMSTRARRTAFIEEVGLCIEVHRCIEGSDVTARAKEASARRSFGWVVAAYEVLMAGAESEDVEPTDRAEPLPMVIK